MRRFITKLLRRDEEGVTALEYGLIAALIAVVIIAAVSFLGKSVSTAFSAVASSINNASSP
jgi:pilus assembly protein Flp/PilA